jgi:hypothetical protein
VAARVFQLCRVRAYLGVAARAPQTHMLVRYACPGGREGFGERMAWTSESLARAMKRS